MNDDGATFSPIGEDLSPNPHDALLEESSGNSEVLIVDGSNGFGDISNHVIGDRGCEIEEECNRLLGHNENGSGDNCSRQLLEIGTDSFENQELDAEGKDGVGFEEDMIVIEQDGSSQGQDYPVPVVGMEFESYDDVYNYYNCYAKELGFAIRVKSSWTKRNSKEKRGAVLCCNCEGFKTVKEANSRRKETRTGCQAMMRLRLVESNRWRVDEVKLEHNHSFDPERALNSKSHKKTDVGSKRKVEPTFDVEVRTIKLYKTPVMDLVCNGNLLSNDGEINMLFHPVKSSKLKEGDALIISSYFSKLQLTNPNFLYLLDINDDGRLRNVFWVDSRSRAANGYFGDVVFLDTSCLSNKYELPLVTFVGVNHHEEFILLGCALLGDETEESYNWLLRAWLTCMSGRPPQTLITDYCKALKTTVTEVFPRARHHLSLSDVMQKILENMVERQEFEAFQMLLNNIVCHILKVDDFELAWEDMVQRFGMRDNQFLQVLYQDREQWVPAYSRDSFFAGMYAIKQGDPVTAFFDAFVQKDTFLNEFIDVYDGFVQKQHKKETLDDLESRELSVILRTRCYYESQLSNIYTKEIFEKFQYEVEMMSTCFNIAQVQANGTAVTYTVKEPVGEGQLMSIREFEVMYDKSGAEVRCICSGFNFKGYLCRHALCILNFNGAQEIPCQYILSRWRKDIRRFYIPDVGSSDIDITNPIQWFEHLHKRALQVSEEGMRSQDHYQIACQALKESLHKVRLFAAKQ
uniref:Protein FAR1-RELATED SEQUENCE n=1 Tax=Kalanchoe fedtschenkoi TaxID=63787 RepID=A0A7N0T6L9_KALFE